MKTESRSRTEFVSVKKEVNAHSSVRSLLLCSSKFLSRNMGTTSAEIFEKSSRARNHEKSFLPLLPRGPSEGTIPPDMSFIADGFSLQNSLRNYADPSACQR
jgi:hypothetical protein